MTIFIALRCFTDVWDMSEGESSLCMAAIFADVCASARFFSVLGTSASGASDGLTSISSGSLVHLALSVDKPLYIQVRKGFHGVLDEIESGTVPPVQNMRDAGWRYMYHRCKPGLGDIFGIQKLL